MQNAIDDAGAKTDRDPPSTSPTDAVSTSVTDDGVGMTLATLEGPLVTAFSSGKEGDDTKIGRYGVGFLSVLAVEPMRVVVATHRAEGAYVMTLAPDRSYVIDEEPNPGGAGTTVTLVMRLVGEARDRHAANVCAAAKRWCEHVRIPLTFARDHAEAERIDRPFAVDGPIVVAEADDRFSASVGVLPSTDPQGHRRGRAGFYNAGLLLFETDASPPAIRGVAFKVDARAFAHTVSRDGLRRDRAYDHAVHRVERLARVELRAALSNALHAAAASTDEKARRRSFATRSSLPRRMGFSAPIASSSASCTRATAGEHSRTAQRSTHSPR